MKHFYKTYGYAKTNLKYHIIFSTKYRRKCLNYIHDDVIDAFKYIQTKIRTLKTMVDDSYAKLRLSIFL